MSRVLAVSPHLDDAVFSLGAHLAWRAARGDDVVVLTCFTASVPEPTGFALRCQTDKGIAPDADYLALRRDEDAEAVRRLGIAAPPVHLPLPEAPHRGYDGPEALFAGVRDDDEAAAAVADHLEPHLAPAEEVLTCQGVGGHVDHLVVLAALDRLGAPVSARWRDLPYGLRPDAPPAGPGAKRPPGLLDRKLDACAAYATQLGFQFGGERAMRDALVRPEAGEQLAPA